MDLRDEFASFVAASLAHLELSPAEIALRAYDIAEAMLAERALRTDEGEPLSDDHFDGWIEASYAGLKPAEDMPAGGGEPDEVPPELWEASYNPRWDLEPRWSEGDLLARAGDTVPAGPGLASVRPEPPELTRRSG